jgi:hypothetical protein
MDKWLETLINFFFDKTSKKYLIKNIDKKSQDIRKIENFQNFGNFEKVGNSSIFTSRNQPKYNHSIYDHMQLVVVCH